MRSIARRRSTSALAGLLLISFACTADSGDGLLSLRLSADAANPPAAAAKLVLTGAPGGISKTFLGPIQILPGSPVVFQFPGLPATDSPITFSVATYSADGCQVGQNAQPITTAIKAGVETGPLDVILISAGPCLVDGSAPDARIGPADVAMSDGTGGFASTGGRTGVGSGGVGAGGGGGSTLPGGGAGGNATGGMTTASTGGRTGGGIGTGGLGTAAGGGAGSGARAGSGGIIGTGGAKPSTGGITGRGGAGTGGVIGTGGSGTGGTGPVDCSAAMPSGGTSHCGQNAQGNAAGLTWSLWSNLPGSSGCITTFSTPAFSATWSNNGDLLARFGLEFGSAGKPYDQYGTIKADVSFKKTGTGGGYSYIGVYGWSENPCVEWYIIDDSYGTMPFNAYNATLKGTATIDGETYKLFQNQTNGTGGSRCAGVTQWNQFWSIRQTARQCGTITITDHFMAWKDSGMLLGKLLEAKILVETGGGTGSIDFPIANVTVSSAVGGRAQESILRRR